MLRQQCFDNALHLDAARTFYQKQISGLQFCLQELRSVLRRRKEFEMFARNSGTRGAFYQLPGLTFDTVFAA